MIEKDKASRVALVAPTAADARDIMVEGESGIMNVCPSWNRPKYEPSKRRITWPSGAMATTYSADEPERLRGPQHDLAWADELAAWRYPEAWDQLMFGLRLGADPRAIVTTTPKPIKVLKELIALDTTKVVKGTTYENRENLAPAFYEKIIRKYKGTRLGDQELLAKILEDIPGALWTRAMLDNLRTSTPPEFLRIVVAIDPAMTSGEEASETGILVCAKGIDDEGYVLEDVSEHNTPDGWGHTAVAAYHKYQADRIVAEVNNGGEMVEHVIRTIDHNVSYKAVHASRGKRARAEPISALYEQGRIHHVGNFPELEDQMCSFLPDMKESPDRVDSLVWGFHELEIEEPFAETAVSKSSYDPNEGGY